MKLKKDIIIANSFFMLLVAVYTILHIGPLNCKIFLLGWLLLNITTVIFLTLNSIEVFHF